MRKSNHNQDASHPENGTRVSVPTAGAMYTFGTSLLASTTGLVAAIVGLLTDLTAKQTRSELAGQATALTR